MNIIKILKYLIPNTNEISLDDCTFLNIYLGIEELDKDLYVIEDGIITINEELINKELCLELSTNKRKLIDYRGDCLYTYNTKNKVLETSNKYVFDIFIDEDNYENSIEFETKLSPMYGSVRKVTNLIKPIIENLKDYNTDLDIEYEIFMASIDTDEYLFDDEDTEVDEDDERYLIKLVEYKTAYNIVYKYYYNLLHEAGTFTKEVGTIAETRKRETIKASDLLERFEETIDRLEAQLRGESTVNTFVKASSSSTGLNDRVWE